VTDDHKYAPAPTPANLEDVRRAAAQGQFLREHADLISPFAYSLTERTRRSFGRLLRSWGETTARIARQEGRLL